MDAFILGPGIVIIGTGFIFEKISYESHVTYVAGFQKKKILKKTDRLLPDPDSKKKFVRI